MHVILSHGRGGSSQDEIIKHFSRVCADLSLSHEAVDDADCQNPEIRTERLMAKVAALGENEKVILMGFSMGGYASLLTAEKYRQVRGLFLVAPGLYLPRYQKRHYRSDLINVEIVHGWSDDVVIYEHSLRYAHAANATLHLMPGSHMMLSQLGKIDILFSTFLQRVTGSESP